MFSVLRFQRLHLLHVRAFQGIYSIYGSTIDRSKYVIYGSTSEIWASFSRQCEEFTPERFLGCPGVTSRMWDFPWGCPSQVPYVVDYSRLFIATYLHDLYDRSTRQWREKAQYAEAGRTGHTELATTRPLHVQKFRFTAVMIQLSQIETKLVI